MAPTTVASRQTDSAVGTKGDKQGGKQKHGQPSQRARSRSRSPDSRETKRTVEQYRDRRFGASLEQQLETQYQDAPNGAPAGRHWHPIREEWITYRKDHFNGRVRPLRMMDNLYDGMSREKLDSVREQRERAAEDNDVKEESLSGDDQNPDVGPDSGTDPGESASSPDKT